MRTIVAHSVTFVAAAALVGLQILTSVGANAAVTGAGHRTFTTTNPCALQNIHVLPPPPSWRMRGPSSGPIKAIPTSCRSRAEVLCVGSPDHSERRPRLCAGKCRGPSPADLSFSSNRSSDFYHGTTGADCWIHGSFKCRSEARSTCDDGSGLRSRWPTPAHHAGEQDRVPPRKLGSSTGALVLVVYPSCPEPPPPPPQG